MLYLYFSFKADSFVCILIWFCMCSISVCVETSTELYTELCVWKSCGWQVCSKPFKSCWTSMYTQALYVKLKVLNCHCWSLWSTLYFVWKLCHLQPQQHSGHVSVLHPCLTLAIHSYICRWNQTKPWTHLWLPYVTISWNSSTLVCIRYITFLRQNNHCLH